MTQDRGHLLGDDHESAVERWHFNAAELEQLKSQVRKDVMKRASNWGTDRSMSKWGWCLAMVQGQKQAPQGLLDRWNTQTPAKNIKDLVSMIELGEVIVRQHSRKAKHFDAMQFKVLGACVEKALQHKSSYSKASDEDKAWFAWVRKPQKERRAARGMGLTIDQVYQSDDAGNQQDSPDKPYDISTDPNNLLRLPSQSMPSHLIDVEPDKQRPGAPTSHPDHHA